MTLETKDETKKYGWNWKQDDITSWMIKKDMEKLLEF